MKFRWKKPLLTSAVISTIVVLVWGAFVFAGMWLRVRCASELANRARPLDEVRLYDRASSEVVGQFGTLLEGLWDDSLVHETDLLDRLEELQRPGIQTVLRNLLRRWTNKNHIEQVELMQTIAFSPGSNDHSVIQFTDGQTVSSPSIDLTVTQSPAPVNAGQVLTQVILFDSGQSNQFYSVTDSVGEKLIVVVRILPPTATDDQTPRERLTRELLIIDSAGQILDRSLIRELGIIGKLAERSGLAEQVVFGAPGYASAGNGTFHVNVVGPGAVRIIDRGRWKTVQNIEAPDSHNYSIQSEPSSPGN